MEDNIQKAATLDGEVPSHEIFNQLVQAFAEKSKDVFRSYLYAEECKKVQNEEFYNLFLEISNDEKDEAIKLLEMTNMAKYDGCLWGNPKPVYNYSVHKKASPGQLKYVAEWKSSNCAKMYPQLVELVLAEKIRVPGYNDSLTIIANQLNDIIAIEKKHIERINKVLDTLNSEDATQ